MLDLRHFSGNPQNAQKQENQRTRLTKRLLREGLLELLRDKPVEHITVKELCELAELNRSTFYAYYNDVPALYQEMGGELANALLEHIHAINQGSGVDTEPTLPCAPEEREYILQYLYMGGTGIIHRWVQNGCALPPEQVAGLIDALIQRAVDR